MGTIAEAFYRDSEFGAVLELPKAGTSLEHPLVYDATARDLKRLADKGMLEVVSEHQSQMGDDWLIDGFSFRKLG